MSRHEHPKVVAVIPARYASTRLPAKPLAEIAGKPMVQHVYERASAAALVDEVIIATDDERIVAAVKPYGSHTVMTPSTLLTGSDRIAHVAQSLHDADIIVNVQGDEPLLAPEMVDEAVRPLVDDSEIMVGTLVRRIDDAADLTNPGIVKAVLDGAGYALYFSRSPIPFGRDVPPTEWLMHSVYYKHIGLYVFRRAFLLTFARLPQTPLERTEKLEQLRILEHGYRIKATVTEYDSIPVDTHADLERVREALRTHA